MMQREPPSTQMSNQLTRRDFAIRTAGFGLAGFNLAMGLAPAATLAEAEQPSRSENSPAVADPYSLVDPDLLPVLNQFPAFDLSAEMVGKFRQMPGTPPLPAPAPQAVERHPPRIGHHEAAAMHVKQERLALLRRRRIKGSPVVGMRDPVEHLTQLVVAVQRWSDGTEGH